MSAEAQVHGGVHFAEEPREIGPFVVIGLPPRGRGEGELETRIGAGAVLRSHTVIYAGNVIGDGFQTGHSALLREENRIGDDVSIGSHSIVEHHVTMGDGVRIHSSAFVPEYSILEDGCWIGPCTVLTNARYPTSKDAKQNLAGVIVERGAIVGANVTVLPGVRIGARALIGAGSVVIGDIPAGMVAVGNPARVIKPIERIEDYRPSGEEENT